MIGSRQNNTVNLALVVIKYCQQYLYHDIISKRKKKKIDGKDGKGQTVVLIANVTLFFRVFCYCPRVQI